MQFNVFYKTFSNIKKIEHIGHKADLIFSSYGHLVDVAVAQPLAPSKMLPNSYKDLFP